MKRIVSVILAAAVLMLALAGCAPRAEISVIALKGPTGMGMAYLMEGQGDGKYSIDLTNMPDDISGLVASGNVDIAAVPVNMASALYNRLDGGVRIIAVNTLGVMYVLENGNAINSLEDLRGGTLYATGQAATPQYILDYLLEKNGLSGDVTVEYSQDHAELSALLASGRVSVGMLPEPNVTATLMSNADIRVALDITELWRGACQTELVQGCIIVRKEFLEKHKRDVDRFLKDYASSVEKVNANPAEASEIIAGHGIMANGAAAERAIPNCNIVCYTGDEMRDSARGMLEVLFQMEPKSIGGAMPPSDFYYVP